jgi:hypothetical protein
MDFGPSDSLDSEWGLLDGSTNMYAINDFSSAITNILYDPAQYRTGCNAFAQLCQFAGDYTAGFQNNQGLVVRTGGINNKEWITGDSGYIDSVNISSDKDIDNGQWLLYVGNNKFYGHALGVMSGSDWYKTVKNKWGGLAPKLSDFRQFTKAGLTFVVPNPVRKKYV